MAGRLPVASRPAVGDLVVPSLDAIVEGSWVALVYAAIQVGLAHGPAVLGPLAFIVAAGAGIAWARMARGRAAAPSVGVLLAVGFGVAGWLADPAVRAALGTPAGTAGTATMETAVTTNAAGWLLGLAVVRGSSHRSRVRDEERTGRLLGRILLLAIPWAIGLAFAQQARPTFVAQALVSTILFAGAGLLAVGLGRLETLGRSAGVDWRSNRAWVAVAVLVVALLLAVSVPAAFLVGVPPSALVDAAWIPIGTVVGIVGLVVGVVSAPFVAGFQALLEALPTPVPTPAPSASVPLVPDGGLVQPGQGDPRLGLTLAIIALVAISIALVLVLSRVRARARGILPPVAADVPLEERSIVAPRIRPRMPSVRVPRRRHPPASATAAYLALLEDLADDPVLARRPAESPRRHAARIVGPGRAEGLPAATPTASQVATQVATQVAADPATRRDLALLVADWELARYGGRRMTRAEDLRAVGRWRRLRRSLRALTRPAGGTGR